MVKKYFASANSSLGFYNLFPRIFDEEKCHRLYVVQGGPGTGKSRFMEDVAQRAEKTGEQVTRFYCSSDPDSLDGIWLEKRKIGMVDGTAPHEWKTKWIGAFEQIMDLGIFWDAEMLADKKEEIKHLSQLKKEKYEAAYAYLSTLNCLFPMAKSAARLCYDEEKATAFAEKLLKDIPLLEDKEEVCFESCVSMKGSAEFNTLKSMAKKHISILAPFDIGYVFLNKIRSLLEGKKCGFIVALDPIFPENAKEILVGNTCFYLGDSGEDTVDIRRFLRQDVLREKRLSLVKFRQTVKAMEKEALACLLQAGDYHFALEKLYSGAMDFSAKEVFADCFCRKRLGI